MKITIANIRDNPDMPDRWVRSDTDAVRRIGGFVLWQEIGEDEDHDSIIRSFPMKHYDTCHRGLSIPITSPKKGWEICPQHLMPNGLASIGYTRTHSGLAGTSPDRYFAWVVYIKKRTNGRASRRKLICIMNTHFVSGAWNKKRKRNKQWRRERWTLHWKLMRIGVMKFYEAGITVLFGGDWNRWSVRRFHPDQRWLIDGGIDKLGVLEAPGGTRVLMRDQGYVNLYSDHHARWARIRLIA